MQANRLELRNVTTIESKKRKWFTDLLLHTATIGHLLVTRHPSDSRLDTCISLSSLRLTWSWHVPNAGSPGSTVGKFGLGMCWFNSRFSSRFYGFLQFSISKLPNHSKSAHIFSPHPSSVLHPTSRFSLGWEPDGQQGTPKSMLCQLPSNKKCANT